MAADIWFAARKTELKGITRQSRQELDALIQKLDRHDKHNSRVRLHITGHADDHDDPYQNEQLAKLRAQTVGLYLLSNGWPPDSVTVEWSAAYNQNHPLDGFHNRRAELHAEIQVN
jgi:outer membrane protein OmpA-like peptidoglycan-associated protein